MQLLVAHQILIASAIALALLFGSRAFFLFLQGNGSGNLAIAVVSFAVAGALGAYFRTVRAKWLAQKEQRPRS